MAHPRRFRFGVQAATATSGQEWADLARKVQALGYESFFVPDHFGDQLGPIPALVAAADAADELRVGPLVLDNDYRHPVVLAKELATLDVLSGGRLEVGLGAGWMNSDYEQSGITHDRAGIRIERLAEAITVIKGLFGDEPVDFSGTHYEVTGLDGSPKPTQRPSPPWLIGGGGERMLRLAAREADIVGINPAIVSGEVDASAAADATAAATDRKLEWVRDEAGARFADLEINCLVLVAALTDDRDGFAEVMAGGFGIEPAQATDVPHALFGTVDQICATLEERRERWGFSYYVVQADAFEAFAPVVERMAGN